jgi:serine/threonine protein kinase
MGADDDQFIEKAVTQLGSLATDALDAGVTLRLRDSSGDGRSPTGLPQIALARTDSVPTVTSDVRADFVLVRTLGEGGMGRVELAHQRSLAREVAIKTLKPDPAPVSFRALVREARITGLLEHPGVIPVHAFGVDEDGRPLLVMKRVAGVDFRTLLQDDKHAGWGERGAPGDRLLASLEILMRVCEAVEFRAPARRRPP